MTTAAPLTRYGAPWRARFASGAADTGKLHHVRGHDPAPLGRRAHLRLDDPMAPPRARLWAPHRRLNGDDPRRHGRKSCPKKCTSLNFQTGS